MTSDSEFARWLRQARGADTPEECGRIEERAARVERQHDAERGPWVGNQNVHHQYGESER